MDDVYIQASMCMILVVEQADPPTAVPSTVSANRKAWTFKAMRDLSGSKMAAHTSTDPTSSLTSYFSCTNPIRPTVGERGLLYYNTQSSVSVHLHVNYNRCIYPTIKYTKCFMEGLLNAAQKRGITPCQR